VSVSGCRLWVVGFRFSRLLCLNLVVDYHGCYFSILEYSVFSSVVGYRLWVVDYYRCYLSICERSVFSSVVGCRFSGVGYRLSVVSFHGYCA
jgi:hypothetical protein